MFSFGFVFACIFENNTVLDWNSNNAIDGYGKATTVII